MAGPPGVWTDVAARAGTSVAVWGRAPGVVEAAVLAGAGWSAPAMLGEGMTPRVAVGPDGEALAAWVGAGTSMRVAERPPDGPWGPARDLTGAWHGASGPRVAIDAAGRAALSWTAGDAAVRLARRPPGGAWSVVVLSEPGEPAYAPRLAVGDGEILVAWHRADAVVRACAVPADGAPPRPVTLSGPDEPGLYPTPSLGPDGAASVDWRTDSGAARVATREGGRWTEAPQPP
jgi:hypothetical protein